ncbi:hypothetical protein HHI36_002537 [Cryptolaemus montrouzieri]|uniref:Uncharacterized protein n=1 Tax=Cryptolaemus montrouzieri TaxID=559131 RepID=A0ABD2PBD6_9CUCU
MKKNLDEMDFETLTDIIRGEIKNATTHKTRKTTGNIKEGWFTTDIKHKRTERDRAHVKNLNEEMKNMIKRNKKHILMQNFPWQVECHQRCDILGQQERASQYHSS